MKEATDSNNEAFPLQRFSWSNFADDAVPSSSTQVEASATLAMLVPSLVEGEGHHEAAPTLSSAIIRANDDPWFDSIKRRKRKPQNVVNRLMIREIGLRSKSSISEAINTREFHLSVVPNSTISNVEKPNCFLRKFSPDGRFLIAFSADQSSLEIYEYRGVAYGSEILQKCNLTSTFCDLTSSNEELLGDLRRTLFSKLFRRRRTTLLASDNAQLNRECSLFSPDGKFVIVVASTMTSEENVQFYASFRNVESLQQSPRNTLEDYSIYCVDLMSGTVTDSKSFKCDKIYLAHNQGLCLYGRTLAILSVQHQTVYLYSLSDEGVLDELRRVGYYLYADDELTSNSALSVSYGEPSLNLRNLQLEQIADRTFSTLKQRIMAFLYRTAAAASDDERAFRLLNFYRHFEFFARLKIWRMQLLDDDTLLLRFATEEVVTYLTESTQQNSFFVIYRISTTEILAVYENVDEDFLRLYENFADYFRCSPEDAFPCSISSSAQARKSHDRYKQTILNARFGGPTEAVKRIVAQLPLSAQSFSPSPYLDLELFSYDEKWISSLERPKSCGDYPITVYGRDSCLLKFQLICGSGNRSLNLLTHRSLVAFIFHPYEPFVISVKRNNRDYVVNFHMRNAFE